MRGVCLPRRGGWIVKARITSWSYRWWRAGLIEFADRARLRDQFIHAAQQRRRDFTVDWVHLKLNDQAQRTVLCKDPLRAHDDWGDRLIASM